MTMAHVTDGYVSFYVRVGELVREQRKKRGVTQEQLGRVLRLNRTTLINIEKGRQRLAVHQLAQLADQLGCTLNDLIPSWKEVEALPEGVRRKAPDDRALSFLSEIAAEAARSQG